MNTSDDYKGTVLNNTKNENGENETTPVSEYESQDSGSLTPKKTKVDARVVSVAGVAGIALGGAAVLTAATLPDNEDDEEREIIFEEDEEEEFVDDTNDTFVYSDGTINFATGVNDDMSFGDAFAAARNEVGPGGAFVWRGQTYGTFTQDEWNSMSDAEHDQWSSHFYGGQSGSTEQQEQPVENHNEEIPQDGGEVQQTEEEEEQVPEEEQTQEETQQDDVNVQIAYDSENDCTVVLVQNSNGGFLMLDTDNDGVLDYMVVDQNGNGAVDEGDVIDIRDQGVTVQSVADEYGAEMPEIPQQQTEEILDEPVVTDEDYDPEDVVNDDTDEDYDHSLDCPDDTTDI